MTEEQLINKVLEDLRRIVDNYLSIDKIQIEKDCTYMSQENPYYIKITKKCSI